MSAFSPTADAGFFDAVLKGSRVVLRPYSEDRDLENIARLLADERVTAPMGVESPDLSRERVRAAKEDRMGRDDAGDWTIFIPVGEDEIFAGEIGIALWEPETHVGEIFAAVHPDLAGKGYGREAASTLIEHIFGLDPVATVRVQTLRSNVKAVKLACSLGFRETGVRFVPPEQSKGFPGGAAVILDVRAYEFRRFETR